MTLRKRLYIILVIEVILVICRIVFDGYSEVEILLNALIVGFASYMFLFYLFQKGILKSGWTRWSNKIILYVTLIGLLLFAMKMSNQIDDDVESFWVYNHNIWLADVFGVMLGLLVFYIVFSWGFEQWEKIQILKNEKSKAELALLKNQINPHFFFNTLNNLYSLIKKDQDQAQDYVLKLSDMMRFTIYDGSKELVSLEDEIHYLQNFIDLQVARYHKQIEIDFEHKVSDSTKMVSPLLFIILLENAFKHGVEPLLDKAMVKMTLTQQQDRVYFKIKNNFDPEVDQGTYGIGLKNLQERLNLVYPGKHQLKTEKEYNLFTTELILEL